MSSYNIGDKMADIVTSIPAMLGYVPDDHIVLIGLTPVHNGPGSHEVGPVVAISIGDNAARSSAQATAALLSAEKMGAALPEEWIAVVVASQEDHRNDGVHVVTELLPMVLDIANAVQLDSYTPGTTVHGTDEANPITATISDYRINPLTAMAAARGDVIFPDHQSWLAAGGPKLREESRRRQADGDQDGE